MAGSSNTGFKRVIKATVFSWQGLKAGYHHEAAFRQELFLSIILIPLALYLSDSATQMALMISSVILVLIAEILNSALEAVVDRFGGELHDLSGRAKDMGSAAVFLALLNLLVIWVLMLWQIFTQQ